MLDLPIFRRSTLHISYPERHKVVFLSSFLHIVYVGQHCILAIQSVTKPEKAITAKLPFTVQLQPNRCL
jgi:hypothetical protein